MAKLTREETAALNALIYIETDLWDAAGGAGGRQSKQLGDIVSELKQNQVTANSGGMSDEECMALYEAVENSPALKSLELFQVRDSDYEKYHTEKSDAPILTFMSGGAPIVVFRGTEPDSDEGNDNIEGAWQTDTEAQERALGYINILHEEYGLDNISVSGHSKGGNKAMYVTVRSDYVSDCTAFDAQGFSTAFLGKYSDRIVERKDRITLIAPEKTLVSTLLSPIAGNTIYTSTEGLADEDWKLGPFPYHKPNIYFTADGGNIRFREETAGCWPLGQAVNGVTEIVSAAACGYRMDPAGLPGMVSAVMGGFAGQSGRALENWLGGVYPDGSPALSTQMWNFIESIFPGLSGVMGEGPGMLSGDGGNAPDITTALQTLAGRLPAMAETLARGTVTVDGVDMAVGSGTVFTLAAAAAAAWTFVKLLELAIPLLQSAGIAIGEIAGLALGMAASVVVEMVTGVVQAAGTAAKAAWSVWTGIAGFFGEMASGAAALIQGIFGSSYSAMAYAQYINVTMSRIEEMRRRLGGLYQCYGNARNAAEAAEQTAGRVSSYYWESYVRSCCSDIQHHIRCAKSSIDSAEYALDRQRRMLAEAMEAYRGKDREAAGTARRYSGGSGW